MWTLMHQGPALPEVCDRPWGGGESEGHVRVGLIKAPGTAGDSPRKRRATCWPLGGAGTSQGSRGSRRLRRDSAGTRPTVVSSPSSSQGVPSPLLGEDCAGACVPLLARPPLGTASPTAGSPVQPSSREALPG